MTLPTVTLESYTAGVDHDWGDVKFSAAYVGTMGVRLPSIVYPNGYTGASAAFAPFTSFDSAGPTSWEAMARRH